LGKVKSFQSHRKALSLADIVVLVGVLFCGAFIFWLDLLVVRYGIGITLYGCKPVSYATIIEATMIPSVLYYGIKTKNFLFLIIFAFCLALIFIVGAVEGLL